jgi:uncharacterized protein YbjT (DUF2867 family)
VILVAGGTGVGTEVIGRLVARGKQVCVLTRDPQRAAHLSAVEVAVGDVRRPADLTSAMRGVHSVVSAVHGFAGRGVSPASVDRDGNSVLIDAAEAVGAHVDLLSVLGASPTHPIELFRTKAAAEERLREWGAPWTIVRAGAFLELHQDLMRRTAGRSGRPLVFGRGDNPISFASEPDVAAAVDEALHDPSLRNTVMEVAGVIVTFNQLAAALEPDLGRGARHPRHIPRPVLRILASAGSTPPGRQTAAALVMDTYDLTA